MRIIFVRRGQFSMFNVLVERCQLLDGVDVQWDRRLGDDRRYKRVEPRRRTTPRVFP